MGKKKIAQKVRKAVKKELAAKLDTVLREIASSLEIDSKKTRKTIAKASRSLSAKWAEKIDIDSILNEQKSPAPASDKSAELKQASEKKPAKPRVSSKPVVRRKPTVSPVVKQVTDKNEEEPVLPHN